MIVDDTELREACARIGPMAFWRISRQCRRLDDGTWFVPDELIERYRRRFRIGDAVEYVAKPIARAIDRVAGTKLATCKACEKRRDWLNRIGGI